jgi:hypothetical protein
MFQASYSFFHFLGRPQRIHSIPRPHLTFCNKCLFQRGVVTPIPYPNLDDHRLSAVHDCLFNIFPATLHFWRPSPPSGTAIHPCHSDRDAYNMVCFVIDIYKYILWKLTVSVETYNLMNAWHFVFATTIDEIALNFTPETWRDTEPNISRSLEALHAVQELRVSFNPIWFLKEKCRLLRSTCGLCVCVCLRFWTFEQDDRF